ncbi:sugar phosphate isomerase/epimerase family protein [Actinacidiphila acididurans]|uniref:Sugar phosphate isomerase/epimerase n=1 Tax=Actinacidiphila acididurans TaxID=2784346 RepID=A0ABS2U489_9ACTN|nr:sugar phosphate isomerase/epimerase family protein [Actinacidiphila acididurans]MBM9510438.1 sugar phosphate isomerase/epimerase [Actinacidiphila acididurans]
MRLAFSTLGVPALPVDQVVRLATEHGYHGVELRASSEEPVHPGLTADERREVVDLFGRAGIEILTVASYAKVAAAGDDSPVLEEIGAALRLAADLGAAHVRVFPGGGDSPTAQADAMAARRLAAVAPLAEDLGVRVLLETHDSHRSGADVARVLGLVGHKSVGALWDVMHTWLAGEQPSVTHPVLAPYLGYVQVKDIASATDATPLPLGAGVLPLAETVEVLSRADWDGWLCWEYEKRWYPQVPDLPELLGPGRVHLSRLLLESA